MTGSFKVAALGHRFGDLEPERRILEGLPAEVQDLGHLPDAEAVAGARDADAVMLGSRLHLTSERLRRLPSCRVIARYGVGVDNVDLDAARELGITVTFVPDYCVEEVAAHALALILALERRLFAYDRRLRAGTQGVDRGFLAHRASSLTLGVAGFGRIGRALARMALAVGFKVAAFDAFVEDDEVRRLGAIPVDLGDLVEQSDVLSLHLPLTAVTRNLVDAETLGRMRPGAILVNVGRGGLIDEVALAEALASGRLAGAGLDVFLEEPLPATHPLLKAPNAILTPHVAWYSLEAERELQTKTAQEVARVLGGGAALNTVTPGR